MLRKNSSNFRQSHMDSRKELKIDPLPLESEFRVLSVKKRLHELSRVELEEFLSEALVVMAKLAHQLTQLRDYLQYVEGKSEHLD
jgi:hypothetical protein